MSERAGEVPFCPACGGHRGRSRCTRVRDDPGFRGQSAQAQARADRKRTFVRHCEASPQRRRRRVRPAVVSVGDYLHASALRHTSMMRKWRPEPESNRRARICSPLRNHSAIGPGRAGCFGAAVHFWSSPSPFVVRQFDEWRLARKLAADMSSLNIRCITGI